MLNEIKQEAIYVLTLCVIIAWFFMILDIKQRVESYNFLQNWEYNLDAPLPTGWEDAAYSEPEYKHKTRAVKPWRQ